ncbi:MAG: 1-deoxy-D-xylulose-5-phosphate reductoisomerase [Rhodobiaceae bacterium]|nr:MAG: 1-deoxy-D-xylulose-5-phosphate reductoisomerase [Rhodobiaceae bacterium]
MAVVTAAAKIPARRRVTILGATGSIGCSTLDLIRQSPEAYDVVALTAQTNVAGLADQAREFDADLAVIGDETRLADLRAALSGTNVEVAAGRQALIEAAARPTDWVMAAIVGTAGLEPTLAAVRQGIHVALANKECLVSAGQVFLSEVAAASATLLPADSEHNAIFQVLDTERYDCVDKIILTASGGPFLNASMQEMREATPAQAVAHPQWSMGAKISVDSATLMNKGLEVIEAHYLFPVGLEKLDVVIHPQSIIHSMVSYNDGSVLAQLGAPDMRTPISYTLAWPSRMKTPAPRLDLAQIGQLTFQAPDYEKFPALALAREAIRIGGPAPTLLNAANEIAVASFLAKKIGFLDISTVVADTLEQLLAKCGAVAPGSLTEVMELDNLGRRIAQEWVQKCVI